MYFSKKISSPLGPLYLVAKEAALVALDNQKNKLYNLATSTETHSVLNNAHAQLNEYFNGKRFEFDLPLAPYGSPFQVKVWNALREIPYGDVWSYGQQAKFIKSPKAFRAVGAANGKNPLPIIIPCHRVVGSSGKLIGYSGGIEMKINLLKHEGHQIDGLQLVKY
jgi:methylated-DNA-[protein]-cysteine S-methyltransferase